jgi:hypothetical protein
VSSRNAAANVSSLPLCRAGVRCTARFYAHVCRRQMHLRSENASTTLNYNLPQAYLWLLSSRESALPIVHEAAKLFKALQFRGQLIVLNVLHFQYSKPKTNVNSRNDNLTLLGFYKGNLFCKKIVFFCRKVPVPRSQWIIQVINNNINYKGHKR